MTHKKMFFKQIGLAFAVCLSALTLQGCNISDRKPENKEGVCSEAEENCDTEGNENTASSDDKDKNGATVPDQLRLADERAREIVAGMTLEEKVYQMFIVLPEQITGVGQVTAAGDKTKDALEKYPVGGMMYLSQNLISRDQTMTMLKNVQEYSEIPLFTAIDEEGGIVSRLGNNPDMGTTAFPSMQTIGSTNDTDKAYEVGYTIGCDCMELGFNLDFAPVADVFSNPQNVVIGERAFSSDPLVTSDMVAACVRGFKDSNMLCTLKHFPGHGDTVEDSHYEAATTTKTLEEMNELEFLPFAEGIKAGADFVMVGHILTPNITDSSTPATMSKEMLSILREDLKFTGVIISDAMNMAAITDYYSPSEAAVTAINAGIDMILVPEDFKLASEGVIEAVEKGSISEAEIDDRVNRIIRTKIHAGLMPE